MRNSWNFMLLANPLLLQIQIYNVEGKLVGELKDEKLTTITSLIAVHPTRALIVGGNSSGKVFAFNN